MKIEYYLDGKEIYSLNVTSVPRNGDIVILESGIYKVLKAVWDHEAKIVNARLHITKN